MSARDPHRYINEMDDSTVDRLIDRLQNRGRDQVFTRLTDRYLEALELTDERVLEIGCGTGVVTRAVSAIPGFNGEVVGIDHSPVFIESARGFAAAENLPHRYEVGDVHALPYPDKTFDVVLAHTVISHVADPDQMLHEVSRVLRPGGRAVFFDGDYASLTFATAHIDQGREMDWALARATFSNPVVMRSLPATMTEHQLGLLEATGDAVVEVGQASYFRSFAETYAPMVASSGLLPAECVDAWLSAQYKAIEQGEFFASCNYYTMVATASK